MALQKSFDSPIGVSFPEAYWLITGIEVYRPYQRINIVLNVYVSSETRHNGSNVIFTYNYLVPPDQYQSVLEGGVAAAYECLKLDELFAGSIDV